ncbi:flagellar basal body-associated FliL family protein [Marinomonas pollencensis]|uniref:Flagellar protein FliL n=1 Tax=Marinomonas pollencensis TaxID=491954 RepID=A0A3E0DN56_9GAMM|nr:flagellar basal body-associated FliL family protein [Marinomonas pollencensis]REG82937.1 flagellar FliL protein [Marinomonas pollencensis]
MAEEDGLDVGAEVEKKGGKKKLIIILAIVLVLLGGGGAAAYFFLFSGSDDAAAQEVSGSDAEDAAALAGPSIYLELDAPFVVDFMVNSKQRYLQLDMTIKSKDQAQIDAVKVHMPLIRNSLVLLLSSQSFDALQTMDGKAALKQAALDSINGILQQETGKGGIDGVLFTNFVMQ